MSAFRLSIETDNAAFEDYPGQEVARILRKLADRVDSCGDDLESADGVGLVDYNGNTVGNVGVGAEPLAEALEAMPTISSGHFANLKIEDKGVRVFLSRMTVADGETQPVSIETNHGGVWRDITDEQGEA